MNGEIADLQRRDWRLIDIVGAEEVFSSRPLGDLLFGDVPRPVFFTCPGDFVLPRFAVEAPIAFVGYFGSDGFLFVADLDLVCLLLLFFATTFLRAGLLLAFRVEGDIELLSARLLPFKVFDVTADLPLFLLAVLPLLTRDLDLPVDIVQDTAATGELELEQSNSAGIRDLRCFGIRIVVHLTGTIPDSALRSLSWSFFVVRR